MLCTIDQETCGLHSQAVLLQYAFDDGPVQLHDIWIRPIYETLELIKKILDCDILGFNIAFDFFHLCKTYTTFTQYIKNGGSETDYPANHIDEMAIAEERARFLDICLKPKRAIDIMLHARKGPYQSLMARNPIKIRKVPVSIAYQLAEDLEKRITFDDIYFAKAKDKRESHWKVRDSKRDGVVNRFFKDIVLDFKASGALKILYQHAFKKKPRHSYREIEVDRKFWPAEYGFAPYALAVAPNWPQTGDWSEQKRKSNQRSRYAWPGVIREHILHWSQNEEAREYAADDIKYTRRLYEEHFKSPTPGDIDSDLACMVAACRWKGYAIDVDAMKQLREDALKKILSTPTAPKQARYYVSEAMDDIERAILTGSTKRTVLEEIAKWESDDLGPEGETILHPAAIRAQEVLDARQAKKEIEIYDKLLLAKRFHASFKIIGALSSRMSGSDGLNPQGIKHQDYVRRAFLLADTLKSLSDLGISDPNLVTILNIGDFDAFEVTIALRVFSDPTLDALIRAGKKVHGLMGMELFPGTTYEEILASKAQTPDMYDTGKKGFFLKIYFGNAHTFNTKLGRPMDIAEQADMNFNRKYPGVKKFQDSVISRFTALTQPGGIGTKIDWRDPAQFAETFLGFKRYFTLENRVIRALFQMAQNPPKWMKDAKIRVTRRERIQTAGGATQSALYAAAFGLQSANIRAAGNHYIQSVGAEITKAVQHSIWQLQLCGVNGWIVQPMNVHDEIACPTKPGYESIVAKKVAEAVTEYKKHVPLLGMDWVTGAVNWAEKKAPSIKLKQVESRVPKLEEMEANAVG